MGVSLDYTLEDPLEGTYYELEIDRAPLVAYPIALFVSIPIDSSSPPDVYGLVFGALLGAQCGAHLSRGRAYAFGLFALLVLSSLYFIRGDFNPMIYGHPHRPALLSILAGLAAGFARHVETKHWRPYASTAAPQCLERRFLAALWDALS